MTTPRFRVWDKEQKVWISDYLGFYITPEGKLFHESYEGEDEVLREVHHTLEEVMFSTNLKDKNGVEIFEGDIVRWKKEFISPMDMRTKHKIDGNRKVYQKESGEWVMGQGNGLHSEVENIEVIGNIYENPELIKEAQ